MAAHSDSSSDPDPTQAIGGTAAGAHAASDRAGGAPGRTAGSTPASTTPSTADDTTRVTPVLDRTQTLPAQPMAQQPLSDQPVPARTAAAAAPPPPDRNGAGDRDGMSGRGAPRVDRQQVVAAQKARYGGIHWGSAFFGWLSANGMAVILIALLSAGGLAFGLSSNVTSANAAANSATSGIGLGAGIALLVALFLAYLAGGYVAGRMARFDGVKQGVAVWVIGLIVVILLALAGLLFGSKYNVLSQLNLPRIPVDEGTATTAGIIALVAVLIATLLGAILGGLLGTRYHRKVDRVGFDAV
jgi:hypothetical protein